MSISRNLSFLAEGVSSTGVLGATYGGTGQSSITTGDLLYGSASNTISKLAIGSTGTILRVVGGVPSWGTDYTGTVTSVAALTLGTTGTDLSSTVANGTTTPVITLNVPTASATNRGVLSSADWTTFNNKGSGSVTSVAASVPSFLSISGSPITTSGTLAITYSGTALPTANGGTALTSFTANGVLYASSSSVLATNSSFLYDGISLIFSEATYGNTDSIGMKLIGRTSTYNTHPLGYITVQSDSGYYAGGVITFGTTVSINSNDPVERMRIFGSGGVSIGNTTDPGAGALRTSSNLYLNQTSAVSGGIANGMIGQKGSTWDANHFGTFTSGVAVQVSKTMTIGGFAFVTGYSATGSYNAIVLYQSGTPTVVSVVNTLGSIVAYSVSGGALYITNTGTGATVFLEANIMTMSY